MKEETIKNLIWAIAITLMVLGYFTFLSILSIPAKWTFEIQMDNNTREAIQSINYSQINNNQIPICNYPVNFFEKCLKEEKGVK